MMRIDYNKLTELLLPTFLRRPKLFALLKSLFSKQLQILFSSFNIFRANSRYEASVTPQTCSLVHAIQRIFDCKAEITELDGKPYDFLLSIEKSTDLSAVKKNVDKHKLAGKSYIFKLGDTNFRAKWINHVDENLIELYSAIWLNHVNEHDGIIRIDLSLFKMQGFEDNKWMLAANADWNVASRVSITVTISYWNGALEHFAGGGTVVIKAGESHGEELITLNYSDYSTLTIRVVSVNPTADSMYQYQINN